MEEILKDNIRRVVQITNEEFENIKSFFTKKSFKRNAYITQAGTSSNQEFFIVSGLVYSAHLNDMGKNQVLQFASENEWLSDSHSFNTGSATHLDFRCLEDTEVYCISFADKESLCSSSPKMAYYFRKIGIENSIMLQKRILLSMASSSKDRYKEFVGQYPKIEKRIPRVLMATYLGASRKTLSDF